jgi:hypothetical protein
VPETTPEWSRKASSGLGRVTKGRSFDVAGRGVDAEKSGPDSSAGAKTSGSGQESGGPLAAEEEGWKNEASEMPWESEGEGEGDR